MKIPFQEKKKAAAPRREGGFYFRMGKKKVAKLSQRGKRKPMGFIRRKGD